MSTALATRRPERFVDYTYTLGDDVTAWIEAYCVHPEGDHYGEPLILMEWQRAWIRDLFTCNLAGDLQYRWALLGLPKKNGKSTMAAALALYHVFGDPYVTSPWCVVGATSKEQAGLVFDACVEMVEQSPALSEVAEVFANSIKPINKKGKLQKIAAAKGRNDGKNITLAILDELHEWSRTDFEVITNGTVGRKRAQVVMITTAGYDLKTVCGEEYLKGRAIERGEVVNPTYLSKWFMAGNPSDPPDEVDWKNPRAWEQANPSYGLLVFEESLSDKADNTRESQFRRYFLNQWVGSDDSWLPPGTYRKSIDDELAVLVPGRLTFMGWDASTKRDTTAVAHVQWIDDIDEETLELLSAALEKLDPDREDELDISKLPEDVKIFLDVVTQRLRVQARVWERPLGPDGKPDDSWLLPIEEVEQFILESNLQYDVHSVQYDPQFITWSAAALERRGIPMEEFPQSDMRMGAATATTYDLAVRGLVVFPEDPKLREHFNNTAIATGRGGVQRVTKARASNPMDATVAVVMAVWRAVRATLEQPAPVPNIW